MMNPIGQLQDGPLDIVGDVHGEIDALKDLLGRLGYRENGSHPDGRRLVFVGDLVDRGPDSPAVLDLVMRRVETNRAQCLLGNHDLNLLIDSQNESNRWWNYPEEVNPNEFRPVSDADKPRYRQFLETLPLALERTGGPTPLRVAHAAWDAEAIDKLRTDAAQFSDIKQLHDHYKARIAEHWGGTEDARLWADENKKHHRLSDRDPRPPFLDAHARKDSAFQVENPVKLITSGREIPVRNRNPFKAGHKWRFVQRDGWWDEYADEVPVIIGHYWRHFDEAYRFVPYEDGPDLFQGTNPHECLGEKLKNVYCVDFSVGPREPTDPNRSALKYRFRLAALRVPEWVVVHDRSDQVFPIGQPGRSADTNQDA